MPLPLMYFQPDTFAQANPALEGLKSALANQLTQQQISQLGIQNQYMPQQLQAKIQGDQLSNALSKVQLQYAPQMTQADLALKQAQTPLMQSETSKNYADIPLTQAQTNLTQQQAKYLPLNDLIQAQNSLRLGGRFGQAYQLHQMLSNMDPATRNQWISQNPAAYNDMLTNMANSQSPTDYLTGYLQKLFPSLNAQGQQSQQNQQIPQSTQQASTSQPQMQNILGQAIQNQTQPQQNNSSSPQIAQTAQAPIFATPTDAQNQAFANNLQFQANRKDVTAPLNNRADNAVAMETWLSNNRGQYASALQNASQYAGLIGQGDKGLAILQSQNPQAYQDYQWMNTSFIPNFSNQVKLMERMGATDKQRDELHGMVDALNNWKLDPQSALNVLNRGIGTIQDISDSVFAAAEPLNKGIYRKMYNIPRMQGAYTDGNNSQISQSQQNAQSGMVNVQGPDGKIWSIPSNNVSAAVQRGGKVIQ